jgi:hypothetical protein
MKCTQLPLVPAFAMTAHKAQGKTMDAIVVDLESTCGTESPYVMISRATSLDGVFILRPFWKKVIQCCPSQDVRNEFKRLDVLAHQTKMKYGTPDEASEAQRYLVENFSEAALPLDPGNAPHDRQDARTLARLQVASSRLVNVGVPTNPHRGARSRCPRHARSQPVAAGMVGHTAPPPSPARKRCAPEDATARKRPRHRQG